MQLLYNHLAIKMSQASYKMWFGLSNLSLSADLKHDSL